ncbi:hypothetical protein Pcinc_020922 [Petrolisthes cinctipes]|uniref:Uncharacterized protein n=1 Tax=Petrolisthes cinctipes TaxID=88211 RepID=A0AAE1FIN2_PETCI|nr:hypothetical protein Pcinc_020922 [Petrolisthes cinctipes]
MGGRERHSRREREGPVRVDGERGYGHGKREARRRCWRRSPNHHTRPASFPPLPQTIHQRQGVYSHHPFKVTQPPYYSLLQPGIQKRPQLLSETAPSRPQIPRGHISSLTSSGPVTILSSTNSLTTLAPYHLLPLLPLPCFYLLSPSSLSLST